MLNREQIPPEMRKSYPDNTASVGRLTLIPVKVVQDYRVRLSCLIYHRLHYNIRYYTQVQLHQNYLMYTTRYINVQRAVQPNAVKYSKKTITHGGHESMLRRHMSMRSMYLFYPYFLFLVLTQTIEELRDCLDHKASSQTGCESPVHLPNGGNSMKYSKQTHNHCSKGLDNRASVLYFSSWLDTALKQQSWKGSESWPA